MSNKNPFKRGKLLYDTSQKDGGNPFKKGKLSSQSEYVPSTIIGHSTGVGESKYDEGLLYNTFNKEGDTPFTEFLTEHRAQNQPWIAKAGAGIGRVGTKVVSEIAKMPGVLGGVAMGTAGQISDVITGKDETNFMQTAFNNAWIKGVNNINETINEEVLPVYVKKAVKEGDIWDNATSIDFWATEGADGLGYIISMLAPGAVINRFNLGTKLFRGAANTTKGLGKYTSMSNKVDGALNKLSSIGFNSKNADLHMATVANTLFEAGAEANSAMESFAKNPENQPLIEARAQELVNELSQERGEPTTEEEYNALVEEAREKASREISGKVGRDVFLFNTAVLIGPNAVMSKIIWGGKNTSRAAKRIGSKGELVKEADPSKIDKTLDIGNDLIQAGAREGFFEEGMQTTGEHYISDTYAKDKEYSLGEFGRSYMDMLQTTEGQKAIMLGAVFGGGMQAYQGHKHRGQEREATNKLIDLAKEELRGGYSILAEDIYERDEQNEIVYTEVNGEKVAKYDMEKLIHKIYGDDKLEQLSAEYDLAVEKGDKNAIEMIQSIVTTKMVAPFIIDDKLGTEVLRKHLMESKEAAEVAEREGVTKDEYVKRIMDKAEYLQKSQKTFNDFVDVVIPLKDSNNQFAKDFKEILNSQYISAKSQQQFLTTKLEELDKRLQDLLDSKGITKDRFDKNVALQQELENTDARFEDVLTSKKEYKKSLDLTEKTLTKFWNKEETNKKFKEYANKKAELKDSEETAEEVDKTTDEIENAETPEQVDAISKGKPVDPEQRAKEEALVKEITDSVNAIPTLSNMKKQLEKLKGLKLSAYSADEVIKAIEKGIKNRVQGQKSFADYLDSLDRELTEGITQTQEKIDKLESEIASHKRKKDKILKSIKEEDKNPKGRNAKILKELIAETEKEVEAVDKVIATLEKKRNALQKDLDDTNKKLGDLTKASSYLVERFGQIEDLDFTSVEEVTEFVKKSSELFEAHRFDIQRLATHKFYTEQNLDGIQSIIDNLEFYRDTLVNTIHTLIEEDEKGNARDINDLLNKLDKVEKDIQKNKRERANERKKLDRLSKAIKSKEILTALGEELEFWENLQKTRHKFKPSKVLANPIVDEKAIEKKKKLAAKKKAEEKAKKEQAARAKELSAELEQAKKEGLLDAKYYFEHVENNFNEGEQIPTPPSFIKLPNEMRKKEGAYYLDKVTDKGIKIRKGDNVTYFISRDSFKDSKTKAAPTKAEATKPLYNTEGGNTDTVIEEGENLPKDKEGNVIEATLSTVENDARVITGTDSKKGLSFVDPRAVEYERQPRNKKNEKVRFKVNTKYTEGKQGQALELLKKENLTNSDIEFLIDHLPINAIFETDAEAPLETLSENPNLTKEQQEEYNKVFNKSSRKLREAIIKEMILNNTSIKNISTTIAGQKPGSIQAPKVNGKVPENSILDLYEMGGQMSNIKADNLYVANDYGKLVNYKNKIYGSQKSFAPGEVYMIIHTANGTPFPLKLNIKKVSKPEAELLYEIYKHRFEVGIKEGKSQLITDTSKEVQKRVREVFKKELAENGLFTKNGKPFEDLTIKDVVDFLIWDGTNSYKSQVRFDKGHLKVMDKIFTKEDFMKGKDAFVDMLTSNKRRNISFKRKGDEEANSLNFENRAYLEYVIENKILNTNALVGKDNPTFQGDTTLYLKTNNVRVQTGPDLELSSFNVAKTVSKKHTLRGTLRELRRKLGGLFKKDLELNEVEDNLYRKALIDPSTKKPHAYKSKLVKLTKTQYEYLKPDERKLYTKIPKNTYYDKYGNYYERVTHVVAEKEQDFDSPRFYNAAKRGDVVDALIRDFFSVGYKSMEDFVKDGKSKLAKVNKQKSRYGDIKMTPNAFRELYNIMQEYEIEFQKRGWTVYSTTKPLWGILVKNGKRVRTAGSMDLLVKDSRGRNIIIDIKTSTVDRGLDYESEKSMYREKDKRQQSAYRELFKQQTKEPVHKIYILPITSTAVKGEGELNSVYRNITRTKSPSNFLEVEMDKDIFEIMGETRPTTQDKRDPSKARKAKVGFDVDQFASDMEGIEDEVSTESLDGVPLDQYSDWASSEEEIEDGNTAEDIMAKIEEGMSLDEALESKPSKKKKSKPTPAKKGEYPSSLTSAQGEQYMSIKESLEGMSNEDKIATLQESLLALDEMDDVDSKNAARAYRALLKELKAEEKPTRITKQPTITKKVEEPTEEVNEGLVKMYYESLKGTLATTRGSKEEHITLVKSWKNSTQGAPQQQLAQKVAIDRLLGELQGISEEKIRKSEEKSVSLQKLSDMIQELNIQDLTDAQANQFMMDIMRTRSLGGLRRDFSKINKAKKTPQEKLEDMLQLVADKESANEDVKTICRNIKKA